MKLYNDPLHITQAIEGCRQGNRKSQEELYRVFYTPLMKMCMRYTGSEDDARSVVIAAFLKVFTNIKKYDAAKATFSTWVHTIVINGCLDHIKSRRNERVSNELNEAEHFAVEAEIDTKLNVEEVLKLVRGLPATTQAVFNLYCIDGYTHREIAGLLDISEGTSKWHLSEARKKLQAQLLQRHNNIV